MMLLMKKLAEMMIMNLFMKVKMSKKKNESD